MRFLIEYKDFNTRETVNPTLEALETFLNEHLIRTFHGSAFECLYIHFIANPPKTKKTVKLRLLYGSMAEMEVIHVFKDDKYLNIHDFYNSFLKIKEAIIKAKDIPVKEGLDYKEAALLLDYERCQSFIPTTQEELEEYSRTLTDRKKNNYAKRIDCLVEQDRLNVRPLTNLLEEFVVHDLYDLFDSLSYRYSELFSNLLRSAGVLLPSYRQIHIHIAKSLLEAKQELALEPWYKMTYSAVDWQLYTQASDEQKEQLLLESIAKGLRYIADFDHLDIDKIESVISFVKENGLDTQLVYFQRENKKYKVEIVYHVPLDHITETDFTLRVTNLTTKQVATAHIEKLATFYAGASLNKLLIKKDEIVIKAPSGHRAELTRKMRQLPAEYHFSLNDLFKNKENKYDN